ncbi:MAG: glycosidase [Thiocapsa sp.]|jgi:sucrose phosphorylase|nr:glycosidase [Thiocapsa sp.]MCG6896882.1 glycosidase [Thiocapsa sp.]MCG6985506.1 glycosidase [Thiocapsa sp.]
MSKHPDFITQTLPKGVMLNAYPDSIGRNLADTVNLLKRPELKDAFSLFYILPTFFNSDLDRGFSIVDYDINEELVSPQDVEDLTALGITFKLDLVLNHLSVRSPQFQDLLLRGDDSPYKDFFLDWNEFWLEHGTMGPGGTVTPAEEHLEKLFMRKPGLPILKVCFPDGSHRLYWNTFYQEVRFVEIAPHDFVGIKGLHLEQATTIAATVQAAIDAQADLEQLDLGDLSQHKDEVLAVICQKREYLGQMDLNAGSELVWEFYEDVLRKLRDYGAKIIRLDAFAYLHKQPGEANFFNRPGTWNYLKRLRGLAEEYDLIIFPEVHAEYGSGIHEEVAQQGYPIYDFFFPGLVIDALDRGTNEALLRWIAEIKSKGLQTINMLGCHDGIPVLDLRGKQLNGSSRPGLLEDAHIEATMERIISRGGRVKNLFGHDGKQIAYYQVNATFFSALGEDERKLLLARAIQMFMPGVPQVWYLDLFAGKNDYEAADRGGVAGHKEINRTTLSLEDVEAGLRRSIVRDQLDLIRLRNTSPAFAGEMKVLESEPHLLHISWEHPQATATLKADLRTYRFTVTADDASAEIDPMPIEDLVAGPGPTLDDGPCGVPA